MPWGRLLTRCQGPDSDTALDWSCCASCGWLDPTTPGELADARAACFVTPGEGLGALVGAISAARVRVLAAVYWLTSAEVASALASRARAGVEVELLVEGRPVGASAEELARRDSLLAAMVDAGVRVCTTFPTEEGVRLRPYAYSHAKYAVVDGLVAVVMTENWVPSSFPAPGQADGVLTRGWGAVVECGALASELERVHVHDAARSSIPWDGDDVQVRAASLVAVAPSAAPELVPARAALLFGPEGWGERLAGLMDVIRCANASIDVVLSELEVRWGDGPSPLVSALLDAAARGVRVRLLVDGGVGWAGETAVDGLLQAASEAGVTGLRAAVARGLVGASRLHAKGLVADGRHVLLGSMNWVEVSVRRNREVDVVLDCPLAAARMVSVFESDWNASLAAVPEGPSALVLEALLEGRSPVPSPLPEAPSTVPDAGGPDVPPGVQRAAALVTAGLVAWGLERRWRPLALARAHLGRSWSLAAIARRGAVWWLRRPPTGAPPPTPPPAPPPEVVAPLEAGGS